MRTLALLCCCCAVVTASCQPAPSSSAPAEAPKELWRGHTINDEYWVQVVAEEPLEVKHPKGEVTPGVGYRWEIGWGESGGLAIEDRRLFVNGRVRGGPLKKGDRIQVNASSGRVTVNGIAWE